MGYSPWDCEELYLSEQLSVHTETHTHTPAMLWITGDSTDGINS